MNVKLQSQRGVSLIELLLVMAAVGFLALLINNLPSSIASISKSKHSSIAKSVANKQIEYLRSRSFANLADSTNSFTDSELSKIPESSGNYTVEDCPVEVCVNGESAKKVTVTVSWNESGESKTVELVTLVGEGGVGQ